MRKGRMGLVGTTLAATVGATLAAISPPGISSATTSSKPFGFTVTAAGPASTTTNTALANGEKSTVGEGTTVTFTATLTNQTNTQDLGSADFYIADPNGPTGFVLVNVEPSAVASISSGVVHLRSLNLAPGQAVAVTFTGYAPCSAEPGDSWTVVAKQSNDFSGPPGNDLAPDTSGPQLLATTGACSLKFVGQPADTVANHPISSQPFGNAAAFPVSVGIYDASGALIAAAAAPASSAVITVSMGTDPTGATLSGTLTQTASGGVANFSDLSIPMPIYNGGYQLNSTAQNTAPAATGTSSPFLIWTAETTCTAGRFCPVTASDVNVPGTTVVSGTPASNGSVEASFLVQSFSCGDGAVHPPFSTTIASSGFGTVGMKSVTVTIFKAAVTAPASQYGVCYESLTPFTDSSGATVTLGLLPNCAKTNPVAPCVVSIAKDKMGNVVESLIVPQSDPWVH